MPAAKVRDGAVASREITVEAWVTPTLASPSQPGRIVQLANGQTDRSVTIGQGFFLNNSTTKFETRTKTSRNGNNRVFADGIEADLTHLVLRRSDPGSIDLFVNGVRAASEPASGTFNWSSLHPIALGGDPLGGRSWLGTYHLVAFYDRALSDADVTQNFQAGPHGATGEAPENTAPLASAGADFGTWMGLPTQLPGTASDDGLPVPPGALAVSWAQLSGPAVLDLDDVGVADPVVTFPQEGIYELEITADDGELASTDSVTVTVEIADNVAPTADAGADVTGHAGVPLTLSGTASDDGFPIPPGALTIEWSQLSGPDDAVLDDAAELQSDVTFPSAGQYTLQLRVSDGEFEAIDSVSVEVTDAPVGGTAIVFVASTSPEPSKDRVVVQRLQDQGFDVTVVADENAGSVTDADLVIISSSVVHTRVGSAFRDLAVPVLTWEAYQFDDLAMTGKASPDRKERGARSDILIVDPEHPIAAGLTGTVTVSAGTASVSAGRPPDTASVIAVESGGSPWATIFAYDTGDAMVGMDAPARRVAIFPTYPTPPKLTSNGWALFDAAVEWAIN